MERNPLSPTATILAFPVGGRREARLWGAAPQDRAAVREVIVDCDAWYHQAAMDETEPRGNA
ncbi:DUF2735 domain-containing protein [uncultured Aureimonas sp.]|uniref:DUF2735 domain-containing protein n=1 Tax=uncultured Aureimonas sp. TaxID=1604662 RepID=UPI00345C618D